MTVVPSSITQMAFDLDGTAVGAGVCPHAARHMTSPATTRPSRKDSLIHEPPTRGQRSDLSASRWRRLASAVLLPAPVRYRPVAAACSGRSLLYCLRGCHAERRELCRSVED